MSLMCYDRYGQIYNSLGARTTAHQPIVALPKLLQRQSSSRYKPIQGLRYPEVDLNGFRSLVQ